MLEIEYINEDLSNGLKSVKLTKQESNPLTLSELECVINQCCFEQHKNFFNTMAHIGMRLAETCAIAWEDIDFDAISALQRQKQLTFTRSSELTTIKLSDKSMKTEKLRIVFLPSCRNQQSIRPYPNA